MRSAMTNNPGDVRSSITALQEELSRILTAIGQKEEQAGPLPGASEKPAPGLIQTPQVSSGGDDEGAFLQLSLKSISALAELSQSTSAWLDRLESVRSAVAAETKELKRLQDEIEFAQLSLEENIKNREQQHQKLDAEIKAAQEFALREQERRDKEEAEFQEKLRKLREENENRIALDQQIAQQKFMQDLQSQIQAGRERLDALEKELERREGALRDEEEEWTRAMSEFEKLARKRGRLPGPNARQNSTHAEQEAESRPVMSDSVSSFAPAQGDYSPKPTSAVSASVSRAKEPTDPRKEEPAASSAPAEEIAVDSEEEIITPGRVEILPPATDTPPAESHSDWTLADALTDNPPLAAKGAIIQTILDLLPHEERAGAPRQREQATPAKEGSSKLNLGAAVDQIFSEIPGPELTKASSQSDEKSFRENAAEEQSSGTILRRFKRKEKSRSHA
jgi:hypothetical protein